MSTLKTKRVARRKRITAAVAVVLLAVVGLVLWRYYGRESRNSDEVEARDRYAVVTRGDFNVALDLDGTLDAIEHHLIRPARQSGRFGLEIVELVDDHSEVKAGDLLFRFSDEKHAIEKDRLELALDDEQTNLQLALEDLAMTKAGNLSNIRAAYDQLHSAQEALSRYEDEDARRKRSELETAIQTARAKLAQSRTELSDARAKLTDAQMQDPDSVAGFEKQVSERAQAVDTARDAVSAASGNLRVFKQYDHPQKMRSLREAVTKAEMALQRDLVNAAGNLVKNERRITNHRTRIRQLETDLAQLEKIWKNLTLRAPADGIITFGNPQRRNWMQPEDFKVGTGVSEGQIMATIPDLSSFLVRVDLPEEFRSRVSTGLRTVLRSKAVPDLVMEGRISQVAAMAQNVIQWDRSSPKVYPIEISTDAKDSRLMPGMSMRVEVVVETVKDVLYLPIEALHQREGTTYARVKELTGVSERVVKTGRISNNYVEVVDGLKEGERVALYQPGTAQ